jgi:hypothetical protein
MAPATARAGRITSALLVSLLVAGGPSWAETTVEVKELRNPEWGYYRAFLAGMDEFEARKREFAPQASLAFSIYPLAPGASLEHPDMRIATDDLTIPVAVDAEGNFTLPRDKAAAQGNAELLVRQRKGTLGWQAKVRSPGTTESWRRMGDYRLECHVRWSIVRHSVPPALLEKYSAEGPCDGGARVLFYSSKPVASIELIRGDLQLRLGPGAIKPDGRHYSLPLGFTAFRHHTLVKLNYREPD